MALNILLADDEKELVETLAERLELRGHRVRTVGDGVSALVALKEELPDVLVLDLFMPGISGAETLARIRQQNYKDLPVIMLTGHETCELGAGPASAYACLTKPIRFPLFLEVLEAAVAGKPVPEGV